MKHFKSLKKLLISLLIFLISLNLIHTKSADASIKSLLSSVQMGQEIEFTWEKIDEEDIDPKIIFWETKTFPTEKNHTLNENSWSFINPLSKFKPSKVESSGKIIIKAPLRTGLYTIYYCASNYDGFFCTPQRPMAVITCKNLPKKPTSKIENIIIFISENHSFDSIYGNYCKAEPFSNPKCNIGPECCEGIPKEQNGIKPKDLTDIQNARYDPCHLRACEESEMNGGKMDKYIIGGVGSTPNNYVAAIDDEFSAKWYFDWARNYAMSDRFFQSAPGQSSQSDMYFAGGKLFFEDNDFAGQNKKVWGNQCRETFISYYDPTVADLLNTCGVSWTFYGQRLKEKVTRENCDNSYFDGTDNPFAYFPSLTNSTTRDYNFRDFDELITDLQNGTLPYVSYVKALEMYTEHPGATGGLIGGQMLSNKIINAMKSSKFYSNNTLVVLVPDESGGFYDHVSPPELSSQIDGKQYGPRTQFIVVGEQAKRNYVSHVTLEPTSLIRFIEWNYIGAEGQLETRDTIVNNIGDLLDENKTGVKVPSLNANNPYYSKLKKEEEEKEKEKKEIKVESLKFLVNDD